MCQVVGQHFGNHVGDWEHNMIRFVDREPRWMHFSQHSDGHAYSWACVEKAADGKRILAEDQLPAIHARCGRPTPGCVHRRRKS